MQQIFSQKLRFKDENGSDYPEWVSKTLGEIGNTFNGLTGKTKKNFGKGLPYIQYKQIFDNSIIDISKCGLVEINKDDKQKKVQVGDLFFTTSSETPEDIATSSVLLAEIDRMYLNSFSFGYRPIKDSLLPAFAQFIFRNELYRKKVVRLAQGSTRYNISKIQFMKLKIDLPSIKEQTKIANFLTDIDTKINHITQQIENTTQFKKGLLQQMFV